MTPLITRKATQARELELEIIELEQRLKDKKSELRDLTHFDLPDLMDQAQTDHIGLPRDGNRPAIDLKLTTSYYANIAAAWPEEKRQAAFNSLTDMGAGDLIKTEITVQIPRQEHARVSSIIEALVQFGFNPNVKQAVHHQTLTAWLKEQLQRGRPIPPLNVIGAEVARVVKLIERKED